MNNIDSRPWYYVTVTIGNDTFEDAIKGVSAEDAFINACDNWENASNIIVKGVA